MNSHQIFYGISILLTGLVSGLLYAYQCSVIKGLGNLNNKEFLLAFQSINKAIQNPYFFISFMGSLIVLPITTYLFYKIGDNHYLPFVLTATVLYAISVFGVTVLCNVPLNNLLENVNIQSANDNQLQQMRDSFEQNWNKWHLVRTIASVLVFISLIMPLIRKI